MIEEVFIIDVLKSVCENIVLKKIGITPDEFYEINYEPGTATQIIDSLITDGNNNLSEKKYPLIASVMPITERNSLGQLEVTIPRIIIAYYTKTNTNTELVLEKYNSDGILKTILRPLLREFLKNLAFSTYTLYGDPDMYDYEYKELLSQQIQKEGLNDFVDIIEINNLKIIIFSQIKSC